MSKEAYVLKNQIHFGLLKTSVPRGTKIFIDRENNMFQINGVEHENLSEVDLCIKNNFIVPFDENNKIDDTVKVSSKVSKNKEKKFEVYQSDVDSMDKDITVPKKSNKSSAKKKSNKMEIIKEGETSESRGMKVISSDAKMEEEINQTNKMEVFNADEGRVIAKIPPKEESKNKLNTASVVNNDENLSEIINESQGKVVKVIGNGKTSKTSSGKKKLTAKKPSESSEKKAKEAAERRKKG